MQPQIPQGQSLPSEGIQIVGALLLESLALNTRRVYGYAWRGFTSWAGERGLVSLPAEPETVSWYLGWLAQEGRSLSTVRVHRAAIVSAHKNGGADSPANHPGVRAVMAGIARSIGRPQGQATGLSADGMAAVVATACIPRTTRGGRMETEEEARRRGRLDIAALSVMRDGMLRVSEGAALTWADIADWPDGSGRLTVRRSKTDTEGVGTVLYLWPDTMARLNAIRPPDSRPDHPVFGLSGRQLRRRISQAFGAAGLGNGYSSHSARIGMAEHLAAAGAGLVELQAAGRWKSPVMPARYVRNTTAGDGAVARYGR